MMMTTMIYWSMSKFGLSPPHFYLWLPSIHRSRAAALLERCWHTKQTTTNPLSLAYNSFNAATNQLAMQMAQSIPWRISRVVRIEADRTDNSKNIYIYIYIRKGTRAIGWPGWVVGNFEPSKLLPRVPYCKRLLSSFKKSYMEGSPRIVYSS